MSWLARSLANSLRLDGDEGEEYGEMDEQKALYDAVPRPPTPPGAAAPPVDRPRDTADTDGNAGYVNDGDEYLDGDCNQGRGVKEDLSELRDSLARQLWGVASFLAPPAPPPPPPPPRRLSSQGSGLLQSESKSHAAGFRDDDDEEGEEELVECVEEESGQLRGSRGISPSEDYYANILEDAVGITEEVLAFARNIAHHPETWLDFPLSEEEEFDDFDISDAQYKHALAVEHLAPRLAALRIELCPFHMSVGYFWMVYFVLLYSRLNKRDAETLSSPQLVEARAMWMQELQKQTKESHWLGMSTSYSKESTDHPYENFMPHSYEDAHFGTISDQISPFESSIYQTTDDHEIEKHPYNEIEYVDKSVIREDPPPEFQEKEIVVSSSVEIRPGNDNFDDDDDDDDWLKEDSDLIGYTGTSILVNEEDISFSDLEDDLDSTVPLKHKLASTEGSKITKTS